MIKKCYLNPDEQYFDFSYSSGADNLYIIFGTRKLLRMLSPSLRSLPLCGLEFTYRLKNDIRGWDEEGYRQEGQTEYDLEMS